MGRAVAWEGDNAGSIDFEVGIVDRLEDMVWYVQFFETIVANERGHRVERSCCRAPGRQRHAAGDVIE